VGPFTHPHDIISLSYKKPSKDKRPRRKAIDETLPEEEQEAERAARAKEDEEFMYRLEYNPTPKTCHQFLSSALEMIIKSTNQVTDLESDLMKSLMGVSKPSFPIDAAFPWVTAAQEQITAMFEENIK